MTPKRPSSQKPGLYLAENLLRFFQQVMFEVEEKAGAVPARAAGKRAVPGDEVCDGQAGHPVVGQSQVTVLLTAPVTAGKRQRLASAAVTHLAERSQDFNLPQ